MDSIVLPNIRATGAGQAATAPESAQDRLLKYIPLSIAGAYPLLENGVAEYIQSPVGNLSPRWIEWFVFVALLLYYAIILNRAFNKKDIRGKTRVRLQTLQTAISVIAFFIWTYSIKSAIWSDIYNAGLAIIIAVLFVLFAGLYAPTVSLEEAREANLIKPAS
jgi:hypothetical protein